MADGAKPDVPTTDRQNEKKKKHRPFYEAVDVHARRRLKKKHRPFYEAVDAHARRRLKTRLRDRRTSIANKLIWRLHKSSRHILALVAINFAKTMFIFRWIYYYCPKTKD